MSLVAMNLVTAPQQAESPSGTVKVTSWASLPVEVRQKVLNLVCLPNSGGHHPKVARFATVCWEWQAFFEAHLFRRLVLDPDSLAEFDAIITRRDARLGYIRKLWLRIRLSEYGCFECDEPEDKATQHRNNTIFTECIQSLLGTLKLWDPARHGAKGLDLMLSASSPSDTKHRFTSCEMKDNYPFHYAEDLDLAPGIAKFHLLNTPGPSSHSLHHLCGPPPWHRGHIKRLYGTPLGLIQRGGRGRFINQYKSLPAVPMVKGLVMRRQFRRELQVVTLSRLLEYSFVALEWFRFERNISLEPYKKFSFDQDFQSRLLPSLPSTLRQFSFTQCDMPKHERDYAIEEEGAEVLLHAQAHLPREMAKLSQRLEQFCPPWQMNTAVFLQSIIELGESTEMPKSSLKRIILRCPLPNPAESRQDFASLVILAAKAALSLPQLEVIELWGTSLDREDSRAYIFRYSYEDGRATVVWRSVEETMVSQARIVAKWSEVAQKHSHSTFTYSVVPFLETKADIHDSGGTCIYRHLLLRDLVFDPITRIHLENEIPGWFNGKRHLLQQLPLGPNVAVALGMSVDVVSLQAEIMAYDAELSAFLQPY